MPFFLKSPSYLYPKGKDGEAMMAPFRKGYQKKANAFWNEYMWWYPT